MKDLLKIYHFPEQYLFYLFCGALFVLPMGTSPFTTIGVCILFIWIITGELFKKRQRYLRERWLLPVLALVVLVWLGLIYTPDRYGLGLKFAMKSHYWVYAIVLAGLSFTEKEKPEYLIQCLLAGLFINAIIGFLQLSGLVPTFYKERYTGLSSGYNTLGILLILGIIIASFYFRRSEDRKEKIFFLFLMLTYFTHLIILKGRGGYLTFVLLSPIVVYNISNGKHLVIAFLLYLLAIDLMSFSPIVQERIIDSIEDVRVQLKAGGDITWGKQYTEDENLQRIDRIYMWRSAIELFIKHPIRGVGTGGYRKEILAGGAKRGVAHPHNNFLYMAVSFGVPGILVLGWFFWVLLKNGWTKRDNVIGFFILSSGLVIFVGGLTDTQILDAGPAFLLAVTTGLQAALPKD